MLAAGANGTLLWYHWSHLLNRAATPTQKDLHAVANLGQCVFFGQEVLGRGQSAGHALMMCALRAFRSQLNGVAPTL